MVKQQIIDKIAKTVKNAINEAYELNEYRPARAWSSKSPGIKDWDLYNFANKVMVPLCSKYMKYAAYAKVTVKPVTAGRGGSELHRAAFSATLTSLDNPKASNKYKVLCKIYNTEKELDAIAIDYNAIVDGYYNLFASIIDGTVYYLDLTDVYRYQKEMGNSCITRNGKFINIATDYFIDMARYSADMEEADIAEYNRQYEKYVKKM